MRTIIVVYVDYAGANKMIEHILDGSLKEFKPSLTVGASIQPIPVLDRSGKAHPVSVISEESKDA